MNKKKIWIGSIIGVVLILAIIFSCIQIRGKDPYSCYQLPICDGKLRWGMSTAEVIAAVGEPSSIEHAEGGDVLTYGAGLPCDFGNCTQTVFSIRTSDKMYDGETFSSGLMFIEMTIDNKDHNSKEAIIGELTDFYGELSPDGGETNVERQLKEGNADFHYQNHFCEEWRAENLSEDAFDRLAKVKNVESPDDQNIPLEKSARLMDVTFMGTEGNPYKIWLDANVLTSYLYLEN